MMPAAERRLQGPGRPPDGRRRNSWRSKSGPAWPRSRKANRHRRRKPGSARQHRRTSTLSTVSVLARLHLLGSDFVSAGIGPVIAAIAVEVLARALHLFSGILHPG